MDLDAIRQMFNRASAYCWCTKKLILTASMLILCGLLLLFFQALALYANQWVGLSLTFVPFFLSIAVLMSLGIMQIRIYRHEIKQEAVIYSEILSKSWKTAIGASYLTIPLILSYLLLWMALGIFVLLKEIPVAGAFLAAVLAFAPFVLNLAVILLVPSSLALLYFITPEIALKGLRQLDLKRSAKIRLRKDPFTNLLLVGLSLLPLMLVLALLVVAAALTDSVCMSSGNITCMILQWFFITIPFAIALSPCVIFFFNFATEAYVQAMRPESQ